jgi:hypothetical protein
MRIRKRVTEKVIAANQEKAQRATGATTERGKANSRMNAVKHSITSAVIGEDPVDPEYQRELKKWTKHHRPEGAWERSRVREVASIHRKLARLAVLEERELSRFEKQFDGVDGLFSNRLTLPIDGFDLPLECGWSCEKIVVRASSTDDNTHYKSSRGPVYSQGQPVPGCQGVNGGHGNDGRRLEVQAELCSTLDKINRYRARLNKDLYRADEAIRASQAERREGQKEPTLRERKETPLSQPKEATLSKPSLPSKS